MIRVEPSFNKAGKDVFFGQFCTGKFWHTIRDEDGKATQFASEVAAANAAREEWWATVKRRDTYPAI